METTLKNQDNKIKSLENKNLDLINKFKNLEIRLAVLEQDMQQYEQKTLSTSLEIAGLPDVPALVVSKVICLLPSLHGKKDKTGILLIEMKSHTARNQWITASKEKSSTVGAVLPDVPKDKTDSRIFIREALTKYMKTLLYNAKQQLRVKFLFVWYKDGKVCARKTNSSKIHYIRSVNLHKPYCTHILYRNTHCLKS
ncbi:hypothetical protein ABMA27_010377 [Loxostege sticticalis]|uniref:Uncharacterized protein n=1 Tax=Loxostege sticticalis TaxID=481309 RepID=A0ABR3H5J4_LOXSC